MKKCKDDKKFKTSCKWVAKKPVKRCKMIDSDSGEKYKIHCSTKCGCVEDTRTSSPTDTPTSSPTDTPTYVPSSYPTASPTHVPTSSPTDSPSTTEPTAGPTVAPTFRPTNQPTTPEPTAGPTHARTDYSPTYICHNVHFRANARPLGYEGKISCDVLHLFTKIDVCSKTVKVDGKRELIKNLCPGKCKEACIDATIKEQISEPERTDTPTASLTDAPSALSCDNKSFRTRGKDSGSTGWISCKHLHKHHAHLDICTMEVNFNGEQKMIRDLCPGKCKSACCVDVKNIYLKLKNSTQRVACHKHQIGQFCNEEVLTDAGAENTQVKDWCPNACGSTCISMPNLQSRVDSGLLRHSGAPSTSDVPIIM